MKPPTPSRRNVTQTNTCTHPNHETIGTTSYTGSTYQQIKDVLYCPTCRRYLVRGTMFLDFAPISADKVEAAQIEEATERAALLQKHREALSAAGRELPL